MRILIISWTFFPEISPRSFRTTELVKELVKEGHDVTLFIPEIKYDYSDFVKKYPINIKWIMPLKYKSKIQVNNHNICIPVLNKFLRYFLEYPYINVIRFLPRILKKEKTYDVLISIAFPHTIHWAVRRAFNYNKTLAKKWIADCGDPYSLCKTNYLPKPFYFIIEEFLFCKKASYITIPEISGINEYYKCFRKKIIEIPQGFNFQDVELGSYIPNSEKICFAYAGAFYRGLRDPRPILDYLLTVDNINYIFYVYTKEPRLLRDYIPLFGEKLVICAPIPRLELLKKLSTMDFLLNIKNGDLLSNPSKIIDYSLTKRPILSINSQSIDKISFNAFLCGDFTNNTIINIEKYNIVNVVQQFLHCGDSTNHI